MGRIGIVFIIGIGAVLLTSCVYNGKDTSEEKLATAVFTGIDTSVIRKLSPQQAVERFGKPLVRDTFDLSQPFSEFRIEIYNYIPEQQRNSKEIKIKEYTWRYQNTDHITVWYMLKQDKWSFLHYSVWPKEAVF